MNEAAPGMMAKHVGWAGFFAHAEVVHARMAQAEFVMKDYMTEFGV